MTRLFLYMMLIMMLLVGNVCLADTPVEHSQTIMTDDASTIETTATATEATTALRRQRWTSHLHDSNQQQQALQERQSKYDDYRLLEQAASSQQRAPGRSGSALTILVIVLVTLLIAMCCIVWIPLLYRRYVQRRQFHLSLAAILEATFENNNGDDDRIPHGMSLEDRREFISNVLLTKRVIAATKSDSTATEKEQQLDDSSKEKTKNDLAMLSNNLLSTSSTHRRPSAIGTSKGANGTADENDQGDDNDNDSDSSEGNNFCAVCLTEYQDGDEICWSHNQGCRHVFHRECILEWLLRHDECPCCRHNFLSLEGSSDPGENTIEVRPGTLRTTATNAPSQSDGSQRNRPDSPIPPAQSKINGGISSLDDKNFTLLTGSISELDEVALGQHDDNYLHGDLDEIFLDPESPEQEPKFQMDALFKLHQVLVEEMKAPQRFTLENENSITSLQYDIEEEDAQDESEIVNLDSRISDELDEVELGIDTSKTCPNDTPKSSPPSQRIPTSRQELDRTFPDCLSEEENSVEERLTTLRTKERDQIP